MPTSLSNISPPLRPPISDFSIAPTIKNEVPAAPSQGPTLIGGLIDRAYNFLANEEGPASLTKREFTKLQKKYASARSPDNRALFDHGYHSGKPERVSGYSADKELPTLMKMAAQPWRSPKEIGTLARVIEREKIQRLQNNILLFQRDIHSAGGTLTPMPQAFYLSQTDLPSRGECAAIANTFGLAMASGEEKTFMGNIFKAAAKPEAAGPARFIKNLSTLQAAMCKVRDFHMGRPTSQVPYSNIITDLAHATTSKTLRVSAIDHAMLAGLNKEGERPEWFYFDPNFGLATFNTAHAFQDGLERTLNRGISPFRHRALGTDPAVPEYNVSELKRSDFTDTPLAPITQDLFSTIL